MFMTPPPAVQSRFADWRFAAKAIVGFWFFYGLTVVARAFLGSDPWTALENKLSIIGVGVVITGMIYAVIAHFGRGRPLRRKAIIAALASAAGSLVMGGTLIFIQDLMRESREQHRYQAREGFTVIEKGQTVRIERTAQEPLVLTMPKMGELDTMQRVRYGLDASVVWLFFFLAWSAFYLANQAHAQALRAQRRLADAESAAQAAQVRALRYQVNPHFLFNTLNSLSSLVMTGRTDRAEAMLLALSTFFRTSLSVDPSADVTLAEEIDLQRLYLDIEKVRFPSRLRVEIDIPKEVESARLPALVLQPLVENAIKYGVSPTREQVTLRIEARPLGDGRFEIIITNSGSPDAKPAKDRDKIESTGVGIANVVERLKARFGTHAKCEFGPLSNGGYQVHIIMPLDRSNG